MWEYYVKDANEASVKLKDFSNGYVNQPYKWQVTLAQGLLNKDGFTQSPTNNKYYDMNITSGTVIGSTPNRIQGALSEYIYKDYFIQLLDSNKNNVGNRALIKSYDHTYGYITPQEGVFTQDNIDKAKYFSIFKNTNDVQHVNTNRIVNNVTKDGLQMGSVRYGGETAEWKPSEDTSKYYFIQTYVDIPRPTGSTGTEVNVPIPLSNYCDNNVSGNFNPGATTLLVRGEGTETDGVYLSAYNGVFLFVSAKWKANETDDTKGTLTITWQRPAMADTWGEFLGQSFFVQQTGENWDSTATTSGEINATQIGFYKEKAIEIYPQEANENDKTIGEIYKTTKEKIYIRPFIGVEGGMRFSYVKGSDSGYIDYDTINTDSWCINAPGNEILFTPDEDTYAIVSFFKTSDENPFYGYVSPKVSILEVEDVVRARTITPKGTYEQGNNKMWKSFQWILLDYNYNLTRQTDVQYSGEIQAEFIGLENGHEYLLTLSIEDEFGNITTVSKDFTVDVSSISGSVFEFTPEKNTRSDCQLHSVNVNFASQGVIKPKNNLNVKENKLELPIGETQSYEDISVVASDGTTIAAGKIFEPDVNNIVLTSEHKITTDNFNGKIIDLEFGSGSEQQNLSIETFAEVIEDGNTGETIANPNRNKLALVNAIPNKSPREIILKIKPDNVDGSTKTDWAVLGKPCFCMRPGGFTPNNNCDYLETTTVYDNDGNPESDCKNLIGWKYNSSKKGFGTPLLTSAPEASTTPNVWSDKELAVVTQADGQTVNVEIPKDNVWDDNAIWYDNIDSYEQINVNSNAVNYSGRQKLKDLTLTFRIDYPNYLENQQNKSEEIIAECWVEKPNS